VKDDDCRIVDTKRRMSSALDAAISSSRRMKEVNHFRFGDYEYPIAKMKAQKSLGRIG
jgi:hypothetical protein